MRMAVSSTGNNLDSQIDPRFGRCSYFLIIETDDMSFEVVNNENIALGGGAGIQAAQSVIEAGAEAVIARRVGPNAFQVLAAAGVKVYESGAASVEEAVAALKTGKLTAVGAPTGPSHAGSRGRF